MLHPAVKAACAPAPSAVTSMVDKPGAFRHAEAPASVVEGHGAAEALAAAVAGAGNRHWVMFRVACEI